MASVFLPHVPTGWHVDQAILSEEDKLVVIRFGNDARTECMQMDEVLYKIAEQVRNFATIYICDTTEVPDFNELYELYDPMTVMVFFGGKHMLCDFGTGDNNKINFPINDSQTMIDILETYYRGAIRGKRFVISPTKAD